MKYRLHHEIWTLATSWYMIAQSRSYGNLLRSSASQKDIQKTTFPTTKQTIYMQCPARNGWMICLRITAKRRSLSNSQLHQSAISSLCWGHGVYNSSQRAPRKIAAARIPKPRYGQRKPFRLTRVTHNVSVCLHYVCRRPSLPNFVGLPGETGEGTSNERVLWNTGTGVPFNIASITALTSVGHLAEEGVSSVGGSEQEGCSQKVQTVTPLCLQLQSRIRSICRFSPACARLRMGATKLCYFCFKYNIHHRIIWRNK